MRIRIPLTLATIEGFLVRVGGTHYVIPLEIVVECVEFHENREHNGRHLINLRGEILPYIPLNEFFGDTYAEKERMHIVIVRFAGKKAGLVVDRIFGEVQSVIKPLGILFQDVRGLSGSTILGSGEVALILDVPTLVEKIENEEESRIAIGRL